MTATTTNSDETEKSNLAGYGLVNVRDARGLLSPFMALLPDRLTSIIAY